MSPRPLNPRGEDPLRELEEKLAACGERTREELSEVELQRGDAHEEEVLAGFRRQIARAQTRERRRSWLRGTLAAAALVVAVLGLVLSTDAHRVTSPAQTLGPAPQGGERVVPEYDEFTWEDELAPASWYRLEFFDATAPEGSPPLAVIEDWERSSWRVDAASAARWPDAVVLRVTEVDPSGIEEVVLERRYSRSH